MKYLYALLLVFCLSSCTLEKSWKEEEYEAKVTSISVNTGVLYIVELDGHEYIYFGGYYISSRSGGGLTHKADCKHPSHNTEKNK